MSLFKKCNKQDYISSDGLPTYEIAVIAEKMKQNIEEIDVYKLNRPVAFYTQKDFDLT